MTLEGHIASPRERVIFLAGRVVIDKDWVEETDLLLYRIQRQDKLALKILYNLTAKKIIGLTFRILHSQEEAEDVMQEVFIKVWERADNYTGSGSAWGWMCVLARNMAIDRLRSHNLRRCDPLEAIPDLLDQLSETQHLTNQHWLGQCLVKLHPKTQQAILLSYVNGYSHSELSVEMTAPLGTVKAWIRRGLQELKQCLAA
jgi:RNA polymerase sigma-70 factor, ECF subfamily